MCRSAASPPSCTRQAEAPWTGPWASWGYPTGGDDNDNYDDDIDAAQSYGMELRDTGVHGFLLPPDQIIGTGEEVWAFHAAVAREIITEFAV